ncbi:hypothetical protein ANN_26710, partial [Periplaneta americana]
MPRLVSDSATEKPASCVSEENGKKIPPTETARQDKEHRHPNKKRYAGCSDAGATSQMEMGRTHTEHHNVLDTLIEKMEEKIITLEDVGDELVIMFAA